MKNVSSIAFKILTFHPYRKSWGVWKSVLVVQWGYTLRSWLRRHEQGMFRPGIPTISQQLLPYREKEILILYATCESHDVTHQFLIRNNWLTWKYLPNTTRPVEAPPPLFPDTVSGPEAPSLSSSAVAYLKSKLLSAVQLWNQFHRTTRSREKRSEHESCRCLWSVYNTKWSWNFASASSL